MWSDDPVRDAERWEQEKDRKRRIGGSWFADLMEYEEEEEEVDDDADGYD